MLRWAYVATASVEEKQAWLGDDDDPHRANVDKGDSAQSTLAASSVACDNQAATEIQSTPPDSSGHVDQPGRDKAWDSWQGTSRSWSNSNWVDTDQGWTSSSWWHYYHGPSTNWTRKRNLRAQAHRQRMALASLCEEDSPSPVVKPAKPRGPIADGQACIACAGKNHRALSCHRQMCVGCCFLHAGGACSWHLRNDALKARMLSSA